MDKQFSNINYNIKFRIFLTYSTEFSVKGIYQVSMPICKRAVVLKIYIWETRNSGPTLWFYI